MEKRQAKKFSGSSCYALICATNSRKSSNKRESGHAVGEKVLKSPAVFYFFKDTFQSTNLWIEHLEKYRSVKKVFR
jgi:hypothetical protein